ncbi:MAG TPA: hypothetical protein VG247_35350 [Pseudonocardiaceae bacterium]|nr:hypothetical protein [Pseudonocardiaceae bacterium]
MKKTAIRIVAVSILAAAVTATVAIPASAATVTEHTASTGDVTVVGDPGNSNPGDPWSFDPLGIPVFGLIQSIVNAPGKILPTGL